MARRGRTTNGEEVIALIALLPWWMALLLALASYLALHALARPHAVTITRVDQMGSVMVGSVITGTAFVLQFVVPLFCTAAAIVSAARRYKRARLVARVASSDAAGVFDGMTWLDFELLVGEAFRLQGFAVEERGGAAADGGVDLVLRRNGQRLFVQCKQWKALQVGVQVVRELYGVMAAHGASGGYIVTSGTFTAPAVAFARSVNLRLIDGPALEAMIGQAQHARRAGVQPTSGDVSQAVPVTPRPAAPVAAVLPPLCPLCSASMVTKMARRGPNTGRLFWSCKHYPVCHGTRPL